MQQKPLDTKYARLRLRVVVRSSLGVDASEEEEEEEEDDNNNNNAGGETSSMDEDAARVMPMTKDPKESDDVFSFFDDDGKRLQDAKAVCEYTTTTMIFASRWSTLDGSSKRRRRSQREGFGNRWEREEKRREDMMMGDATDETDARYLWTSRAARAS